MYGRKYTNSRNKGHFYVNDEFIKWVLIRTSSAGKFRFTFFP